MKKISLLILFLSFLFIGLTGCEDNATPTTEYTVTFDAGTGGTLTSAATVKVKEGEKVAEPTDPTRDGFTFVEWQKTGTTTAFNFATETITANITLTAQWEQNFTVTFDGNQGMLADGSDRSTVKVKSGEKVAEPTDPTRDGFSFLGWQDTDSKTFDFNTAIAADITLTAGWKSASPGVVSNVVIELDTIAMPTEFRVASYVYTDGDGTVVPNSTAEVKWLASDNSDGTSATEVSTGATYSPVGVDRYKFVSASVRVKSAENSYTPEVKSTTSLFAGFSTEATRGATSTRFSGLFEHTSVRFKDKIWVIGGYDGRRKNDVWSSADGIAWTQAPGPTEQNPRFSERSQHTSVVFNDSIWVIGGVGGGRKNDVWLSEDGSTWVKKPDETAQNKRFSSRQAHSSVVFNNKIWVIGGVDGSRKNDVWSSEDGVNWKQVTNPMTGAAFSPRYGHSSVVFNNKIWVIGGDDGSFKDDVWSSEDGANWTQVTPADTGAPFSGRVNHTSVIFDGKIWVIGGNSKNDVWSSEDGRNWIEYQEVPKSSRFSKREQHTSVASDDKKKIWVIGGYDGSNRLDDVWY